MQPKPSSIPNDPVNIRSEGAVFAAEKVQWLVWEPYLEVLALVPCGGVVLLQISQRAPCPPVAQPRLRTLAQQLALCARHTAALQPPHWSHHLGAELCFNFFWKAPLFLAGALTAQSGMLTKRLHSCSQEHEGTISCDDAIVWH